VLTNSSTTEPRVYYAYSDHLNTPRVIVNSTGDARWRWISEPFGTTAAETIPNSLENLVINLRFPGQYFDKESGLSYNYFRDYDGTTGRYVQSDPIGINGGLNTFAYVENDPLRYADPRGECPWCVGAAIGGGYDIVLQLIANGGNLRCVNVGQVLASAAMGAVGGGIAGRGLNSLLMRLRQGRIGDSALALTKKNVGENLSLVENLLKGRRLLSTDTKSIPGMSTMVDSTWRNFFGGGIRYVESKFGTSGLTWAQSQAKALVPNYVVERWGYDFFGRVGGYAGGAVASLLRNPGSSSASGDDCECNK
jgi:RHS repeat-associated protein